VTDLRGKSKKSLKKPNPPYDRPRPEVAQTGVLPGRLCTPLNVLGHLTMISWPKVPMAVSKQPLNTLDNAVNATPPSQLHQGGHIIHHPEMNATRAQARLGDKPCRV